MSRWPTAAASILNAAGCILYLGSDPSRSRPEESAAAKRIQGRVRASLTKQPRRPGKRASCVPCNQSDIPVGSTLRCHIGKPGSRNEPPRQLSSVWGSKR